ncbi:MAG: amidohydrolase [Betaproteobacteria bacterium]|nr:amidohydrolase [Betaproteobacteria bacterium]
MLNSQDCDLLVTDIDWLISVDRERRVIRDAALAVQGGRFVAVGKSDALRAQWQPRAAVSARGCVVTPGLIDNHLHASFQLSRGLADEANAQQFLFEHMYPYEAANTREDVEVSSAFAALELLRHGVTCFTDPGNYHPDATIASVMSTGMRLVAACSCFDKTRSVMGLLPASMIESTEACLEKTEALFERYLGRHHGRLTLSASFRGMNNASDELITGLKDLANKHQVKLQTHACFSYQTHDASLAASGKAEIERLEALGVLDENMILVHSGWLEPQELALLVKRKPTLVCSPSSSLHNGYGYMSVGKHPELMAMGVNVSLGSDHASSGVVDMTQEMRMAACLYKEVRMNPRVMPPELAVEMATINGARGVGLENRIGSIEVGKEADFVLFDAMQPEWQPLYNPVSNLVYSATGSSVRDVFVAGEQVLKDGRLTRVDHDALMRQVGDASRRIASRLDMKKLLKGLWPVS